MWQQTLFQNLGLQQSSTKCGPKNLQGKARKTPQPPHLSQHLYFQFASSWKISWYTNWLVPGQLKEVSTLCIAKSGNTLSVVQLMSNWIDGWLKYNLYKWNIITAYYCSAFRRTRLLYIGYEEKRLKLERKARFWKTLLDSIKIS